jgi:hypothetical protein
MSVLVSRIAVDVVPMMYEPYVLGLWRVSSLYLYEARRCKFVEVYSGALCR